jgi:hypothetical protein
MRVVSWLLIQISTRVFPFFEIPNWAVRLVVLLLIIGFPVAVGLSWQVVPAKIREWMEDKEPLRTQRVMHAVMGIKKLDMAAMQRAYDGK